MASNIKISDLTELASGSSGDWLVIVDSITGLTKKIDIDNLPSGSLVAHLHTSAGEGGDLAAGDLVDADVTYLKALLAGVPTVGNILDKSAVEEIGGAWTFNAALIVGTANGIDVNPGSDIDADLITVGVTGAPKFWWDESESAFSLNLGLRITAGIVEFPNGAAATPTVVFAGAPTTGLFWASNYIGMSVAGVLEALIDANGIQTGNAQGPALFNEVPSTTNPSVLPNRNEPDTGVGWASDTVIFIGGGAELGRINATGLGLDGATSPIIGLQMGAGVPTSKIGLEVFGIYQDDNTARMVISQATVAGGAGLNFARSRGTHASPSAVVDGDDILAFSGHAHDGTNYLTDVLYILGEVDGTPGTDDMPTRMAFYLTPNGGSAAVEVMRLTQARNALFNTTTVDGTAVGTIGLGIGTEPGGTVAGGIQIYSKDSSAGAADATLGLYLETAPIGIGTFTPSHKIPVWINGVEYHIQLDAV